MELTFDSLSTKLQNTKYITVRQDVATLNDGLQLQMLPANTVCRVTYGHSFVQLRPINRIEIHTLTLEQFNTTPKELTLVAKATRKIGEGGTPILIRDNAYPIGFYNETVLIVSGEEGREYVAPLKVASAYLTFCR